MCLLIVLLSVAGGYLYSWRFIGRIMIIKDARDKLNSMEREIMFSMDTLPDICGRLAKEEGPFSTVFEKLYDGIDCGGEAFGVLWKKCVIEAFDRSVLKNDQRESLADLGRGLGQGDIEEQKKCFARINAELNKLFSEAEEEKNRLRKMYMCLFISGGMAISIILI